MFIKESDAYIDIKKNVSKKIPLKIAIHPSNFWEAEYAHARKKSFYPFSTPPSPSSCEKSKKASFWRSIPTVLSLDI